MRIVHIISFHTIFKLFTTAAVLTLMPGVGTAQAQESLVHRPEHVVSRAEFEASISGGLGVATNNLQSHEYDSVVYRAAYQAGSASFTPTDSPAMRIDDNVITSPFAGVGSLKIVHNGLGQDFICSGTVITPNHVLTAGHCFDQQLPDNGMLDPGIDLSASSFILNANGNMSSTHVLSSVTIHPDFGGFFTTGSRDDLAIVELATPVPMSTPKYAVRNTPMTSAEVLEFVGYGQSGFGDMGYSVMPTFVDKRSGKNEADLFVLDDEGGGFNEVFIYDFDSPPGYTPPMGVLGDPNFLGGTTLGNAIETTVGGGDSGGPAFVEIGGDRVIAGVSTIELAFLGTTPPAGFFGSLGGGADIAPYTDWIVSVAPDVMVVPEPTSSALLLSTMLVFGCWRRRHAKRVA